MEKDDNLEGLIYCHADDFFWRGTGNLESYVITILKKIFTSQEVLKNFKYLGLNFDCNSRPEVFCKKDIFKNFAKFTGKHLCQTPLLNKVAGLLKNSCFIEKLIVSLLNKNKFVYTMDK